MDQLTLRLIALVSRTGTGLATAVSALFVTQVSGLSLRSVGLTLTAATAIAVAASTWLGHLADRLGAREVYAGMLGLQAIGVAGLVLVRDVPAYALVALALAIGDLGQRSAQGAVIHAVVPAESRLRVRAQVRVAANAGFAVGAGLGGIVLATDAPAAYRVGLLVTAVLLLATGALILRLPRVPAVEPGASPWAVLRDGPFVGFMALNGVLNIHNTMLNVAVPLWIATQTSAPTWMVSVLLVTNAVAVILFQIRLTRGSETLKGAGRASRRAGLLLCFACVAMAPTAHTSTLAAVILLLVAAVLHVVGEILESAGGWGASYALAPPGLVGQYQGGHAMGRGTGDLIGPTLFTAVVIPLGSAGWLLAAVIFALAGVLIPLVLRTASSAVVGGWAVELEGEEKGGDDSGGDDEDGGADSFGGRDAKVVAGEGVRVGIRDEDKRG
ncbi:MFS transporter [Kribbella sp. NPDC023855]|uniref:MFS transporter n=1 Tax=Kribbella sp. NPDC023855 TaxID=3154698 RepID=UPI0033C25773